MAGDDRGDDGPVRGARALLVDRLSPRSTPAFALGYVLTWTAVGIGAFGAARVLADAGAGGRHATAPLLAAAGLYQLTPLKRACLRRCRSPFAFLRAHADRSPVRAGAAHGAYCVGCCAGLMLMLFALGVMSLFWMAVVAAVIAAEKVAPHGDRLSRPLALALVAAAVGTAFA
jgi:predicted metal-binding membrane protein